MPIDRRRALTRLSALRAQIKVTYSNVTTKPDGRTYFEGTVAERVVGAVAGAVIGILVDKDHA